ncbi:hypothetical protein N9A28_01245 [Sulfurimonas sp.]|nr:hypothetical protein [Sulfurimonas sp.]
MNPVSSFSPSITTSLNTKDTRHQHTNSESANSKPKVVLEAQDFYDMANKYNVKNISNNEIMQMSQELFSKQEISLQAHATLTLDSRKLEPRNHNLINEYKTRAELNQRITESGNMLNNKEVLEILIKLDTLKSREPLNIKV